MTHSMTASAQASTTTDFGELSCEFRTVNHRYLEIAPRMPEELRVHETAIRELINSKLARSRVDVFIRLKEIQDSALEPNQEVASQLQELLTTMKQHVPTMQDIRAIDVLRWPGVLQAKEIDPKK